MFELQNHLALLKNVNIRRGKTDDAFVAIDLKFECEDVPSNAIASILGTDDPGEVVGSFFQPMSVDADANRRYFGIKRIQCDYSVEGKHTFTLRGQRKMRTDRVGKVELKPRAAGKWDLTFSVSMVHPAQGFVEYCSDQLNRAVRVTLEADPELDLKRGAEKAPPPEAKTGDLLDKQDAVAGTETKPAKTPRKRAPRKAAPKKAAAKKAAPKAGEKRRRY